MVLYFPPPYPDELFYSILSRFHSHTCSNVLQTSEHLFGAQRFSSSFHIPNKIETVVSRISAVSSVDVDTFIKDHTLYPFLASFGDKKRAERMYNFMAVGGERFVLNRISGLELGVYNYCPLCAIEDRRNFGETYWHRVHNLPSVISCTKHKCRLKGYLAKQKKSLSYSLVIAESVVDTSGPNEPASDLEVSEDLEVEKVLFGKTLIDFQEINRTAQSKGFIRITAKKVFPLINNKLRSFVENNHPRFVHLTVSENLDFRLPAILAGKSDGTQPRLCMLIKEFVELEKDSYDQIYPKCLNKCCKNHNIIMDRGSWEAIEKERKIGFTYLVKCPICGLKFVKSSPYSKNCYCLDIGQQCKDDIRKLHISGKSARFIIRQYGLPRDFLKKLINERVIITPTKGTPQPVNRSLQKKYRNLWLSALKSGKFKTLSALIEVAPAAQNWLYKKDREWVNNANNKYLKKNHRELKPKNYSDIDEDMLNRLKGFMSSLDLKIFPRRLTRALFDSNIRGLKRVDLSKLPKSFTFLSGQLEDQNEFKKRCITYSINK